MTILAAVSLYLAFGAILAWGLLRVLGDLLERSAHDEPVFDDQPINQNLSDEPREARSQFAWQSRSHSQAPD